MSVISGSLGAVMGANAQEESARQAAESQRDATRSQERIFAQQRGDFEPYRTAGLAALPYLQSAILGGTVSARDTGYAQISDYEAERLGKSPSFNWYRAPDGSLVKEGEVPMRPYTYGTQQSPAAKYQLEQGNTALMRSLGARGLAGSGGAAVKLADLSKSVAASDWQDQYNRLLDLVKTGTGASAATGGAASSLANAYGQGAANLGNIYNQAGQAKAGLYSGMGNASANTFGTGLRAYQYGQSQGWWGGAGGTAAASYGGGAGVGGSSFAVSPTVTQYGTYSLA